MGKVPEEAGIDQDLLKAYLCRVLDRDGLLVEQAARGVSGPVYRVMDGQRVLYARVGEDASHSLVPEARVHEHLRSCGVRVPDVVHIERFEPSIGRSVLVVTEVCGHPLCDEPDESVAQDVVRQAGRDLACINATPVDGFGWVGGDNCWPLRAEQATWEEFALDRLETTVARLRDAGVFDTPQEATLSLLCEAAVDATQYEQGRLAHGDLDVTHIYVDRGRYAGIIDFGEIRGTEASYDLSHFLLHDTESHPAVLFPHLERAWRDDRSVPPDHDLRIWRGAILIGLRRLERWLDQLGPAVNRHAPAQWMVRRLDRLLQQETT
jgi:Ser/Thr protein kinase RdoA (MazF antagonist)